MESQESMMKHKLHSLDVKTGETTLNIYFGQKRTDQSIIDLSSIGHCSDKRHYDTINHLAIHYVTIHFVTIYYVAIHLEHLMQQTWFSS